MRSVAVAGQPDVERRPELLVQLRNVGRCHGAWHTDLVDRDRETGQVQGRPRGQRHRRLVRKLQRYIDGCTTSQGLAALVQANSFFETNVQAVVDRITSTADHIVGMPAPGSKDVSTPPRRCVFQLQATCASGTSSQPPSRCGGLTPVPRLERRLPTGGARVFSLWRTLRDFGTDRLAEVDRLVETVLTDRASLAAVDLAELKRPTWRRWPGSRPTPGRRILDRQHLRGERE